MDCDVPSSELEKFADYCREWYYNQSPESGRLMTQTLATLPPSQRAPFSRVQATIRSGYHRSVNIKRNEEFITHLIATQPGASLSPQARTDSRCKYARNERYDRFQRFITSWCSMGMPGPQPFFTALWALMRLQVLPESLGGAGPHRIEWAIDDAVFKEAAGKDFMFEAIDLFKGVLAFEDLPTSKDNDDTIRRARASSDPFLDSPRSGPSSHFPLDDDDEYTRIWISPDLPNSEYLALLKLFPAFISRTPLPRFKSSPPTELDLEEGVSFSGIRIGTGQMWKSSRPRRDGWRGSFWTRFLAWWRRIFG